MSESRTGSTALKKASKHRHYPIFKKYIHAYMYLHTLLTGSQEDHEVIPYIYIYIYMVHIYIYIISNLITVLTTNAIYAY